jgi:hypothetical protein
MPDTLKTVAFIEKDTKRSPNTHGWAYAQWDYDPATDTFKPSELSPSGSEWVRVPYQGVGAGLHLDRVSKKVKRGSTNVTSLCSINR